MKVIIKEGFIAIEDLTWLEAEILMIVANNGAEARKSCQESSRILRRLAMQIDKVLPDNTTPTAKKPPAQLDDSNLFIKRLNKVN